MRWRIAVAILALGLAADAQAFVRQKTSSGKDIAWRSGCVFLTPDRDHIPSYLDRDQVQQEIVAAARNWTDYTRESTCSYLQVDVDAASSGRTPGTDGINLITWLTDRWGHVDENGSFTAYSPDAPALTFIVFVNNPSSPQHGEILDADIELNGADARYRWAALSPLSASSSPFMDIQNTLTHEIGHLLGLDHTCYVGSPSEIPTDGEGIAIPSCSRRNGPEITEATMYNFTDFGETKKRSIQDDDRRGICAAYPASADPHTCARVDPSRARAGDGCAFAPSSGAAVPPLLLVLAGFMARACIRGRRRSGCASGACDRARSCGAA